MREDVNIYIESKSVEREREIERDGKRDLQIDKKDRDIEIDR